MAHYEDRYNGDFFETEDDAREAALEEMSWDDYEEKFKTSIGFSALFTWARTQPGFFEYFENEIYEAESDYFDENFVLVEDDKDDREED